MLVLKFDELWCSPLSKKLGNNNIVTLMHFGPFPRWRSTWGSRKGHIYKIAEGKASVIDEW